jgi:precorrin-6B methylase 2
MQHVFAIALWWFSALCVVFAIIRVCRSQIYDFFIIRMTSRWYRMVLERLDEGALLLDVGIGTGSALCSNRHIIAGKKLRITGIDYDEDYVMKCGDNFRENQLQQTCKVQAASFYDWKLGGIEGVDDVQGYDAAYFSGSLMLMPDSVGALRKAAECVKAGAPIYVTQTFQTRRSKLLEFMKPVLKWVTTIDFGTVSYESEFLKCVADAGLTVRHNQVIDDGAGPGAGTYTTSREARLIIVGQGGRQVGSSAASVAGRKQQAKAK